MMERAHMVRGHLLTLHYCHGADDFAQNANKHVEEASFVVVQEAREVLLHLRDA
jgi:hypothetical protein